MNTLSLVRSENFCGLKCDFFGDGEEFWVTRAQMGAALEYNNPATAIKNIHSRYKERLDKYSRVAQIELPSGGPQSVVLYSRRGVMEICRHSDQPKADAFMDFTWDVMDSLASGTTKLTTKSQYVQPFTEAENERLRIRKAELLSHIADSYDGTYRQILQAYAAKELVGKFALPLPEMPEETFTAEQIGSRLGISANKVGRIANAYGLKTEEYGKWFVDKSRHSSKEVRTFRYFESVIPEIKQAIAQGA